jgi:fructoselysine-6-P-deglycase FrlB-like protein
MDYEPELRTGPPWIMEEMIAAEATLPREIAAAPGTAALGDVLGDALREGEPVLFTGCGTSEHAARACAAIAAAAAPGAAVAARDAFEVQLDPPDHGLVVAISHEGGTASTLATTAAAPRAALITAQPGGEGEGVLAVATPRHDESWCHTLAYISPMLAVALALEATTAEEAELLIAAELAARPARRVDAERLAGAARLLAVGSGLDEITGSELALKIEEAAHVPVTPLGAEKVLHGHLPAADAGTGALLLRFDPTHAARRDARAENLAAAAAVLEMPVATLRPAAPVAGPAGTLLAGALALQLLTLELAHVRGTNPDLIRREQETYRRAAAAGAVG